MYHLLQTKHLWQITSGDSKYHKTSSTTKEQECSLTYFPSKSLDKRQTAKSPWKLHQTKNKLCEVDVETKIANIEAQSIVDQVGPKPVDRFKGI